MDNKDDRRGTLADVWAGIGISFGIFVLGIIFIITGSVLSIVGLFGSVIAPLVLAIIFFVRGRTRLGQGLLIGLGINILLISACWGLIWLMIG